MKSRSFGNKDGLGIGAFTAFVADDAYHQIGYHNLDWIGSALLVLYFLSKVSNLSLRAASLCEMTLWPTSVALYQLQQGLWVRLYGSF